MLMSELEQVKGKTYLEYCSYLQSKYGIGRSDYFTPNFSKKAKCSRTNEGLITHHLDEDKAIMLSTPKYAKEFPFEWQTKEHLVYCDLLEHLLLHVLICYYPSPERVTTFEVGLGGAVNFLIPELNDVYSGWITKQDWKRAQHDRIIEDKDVYLSIVRMLIPFLRSKGISKERLHSSFNEPHHLWSKSKNEAIFKELDQLWM